MTCPDCQGSGKVRVVSQDPATGEWTHQVEARCASCNATGSRRHAVDDDAVDEPTDLDPTQPEPPFDDTSPPE